MRLPRGYKRTPAGKVIKLGSSRGDRGYCTKCGLVMDDMEPFGAVPEWFHKVTSRCDNDGAGFLPGTDLAKKHGIVPFQPKRNR